MYKHFFLSIIILFLLSSCNEDVTNSLIAPYSDTLRFKVHVDYTITPDTINIGDTIKFKLYGHIGNDGCHSFSHFERYFSYSDHTISVWGKYVPATICTLQMVNLSGEEYKIIPRYSDTYYLNIIQPNGSVLKDSVVVR